VVDGQPENTTPLLSGGECIKIECVKNFMYQKFVSLENMEEPVLEINRLLSLLFEHTRKKKLMSKHTLLCDLIISVATDGHRASYVEEPSVPL